MLPDIAFATATRILSGCGQADVVASEAAEMGRHAFPVHGPDPSRDPDLQRPDNLGITANARDAAARAATSLSPMKANPAALTPAEWHALMQEAR